MIQKKERRGAGCSKREAEVRGKRGKDENGKPDTEAVTERHLGPQHGQKVTLWRETEMDRKRKRKTE